MTDEELIALADALEQMEGMMRRDDEVLDRAAAAIRAMIAAREKGWRDGVEAAARYIQDEYPHDKRALVPAIRALASPPAQR